MCSIINNSIININNKSFKIINIDKLIDCNFQMPNQDNNMYKILIINIVYNFNKSLFKTIYKIQNKSIIKIKYI